ncbi:type IV toxin-antitoxin system AbiEi family antitoxin domain-containing protein [uncultured Williamsia sp.]|uniref:type IV toxin-antitoxin system AbiEi family antitoxin domain-containing protein n=1 Tax=uncultured Williamsia sp. TaxID=259311 RepID=UPI00345793BD
MHSPVMSRTQLLAMGRDDSAIRRAVADGTLIRLRSGWYARPDADAATMEAVRRGGVLSCVSALRHHGLWIPPGHSEVHVRYSRHGTSVARGRRCRGQGRALPLTTAVDCVPVALDCATRCLSRDE